MPASSFHHYYLSSSTIFNPIGMEKDMDEEGMNSDEANPSRNSSDGTRDSQGHFVMHLAGTSEREVTEKGNSNSIISNCEYDCSSTRNMPMFSDAQYYCYSLLEAMPMPGPVWSTTEPCVLAEPPKSEPAEAPPTSEGGLELEWGENQASSYSWWIGFLESLDGNNMSSEKVKCPFEENIVMEDSKGFGYDSTFVGATDQSCCLDDWLMIPTMEMDLEDMVVP